MGTRLPLVLADDGTITQLQAGDNLATTDYLEAVYMQNSVIIKLLANVYFELDPKKNLSDQDINAILEDL